MNTTNTKKVRKSTNIKDKVKIFGKDYMLNISYKNIKISELNLEENAIQIYLPNKYKKVGNKQILNIILDKMYDEIAKDEVERIMEKTRIKLGFAPEDYEIKRIKNSLAKCSFKDKTITINPEVVKYKKEVLEYTILREFCNLKYKTHTKGFFQMMKTYMPNYEKCVFEIAELQY